MNQYLNNLPQKPPFRFLDQILAYKKGQFISGIFDPRHLPNEILASITAIPASFLTEGLAQLSVIFVQLETEPLKPGEFPLLGSINMKIMQDNDFGTEPISYLIEPIKIFKGKALLHGTAKTENKVLCAGDLSVAKTFF